jgi:hypothetical protein
MELLTDFEKKKKARSERIIAMYRRLKKQYPNTTNNRIYGEMASDIGLSAQGIRLTLIKYGVVKKRVRNPKIKSV